MKKYIGFLLLLTLCLSLAACELPFVNSQQEGSLYQMLECQDFDAALKSISAVAEGEDPAQLGQPVKTAEKYQALTKMLEGKDYDAAYCYVLKLYHESDLVWKWMMGDKVSVAEVERIVFGTWYTFTLPLQEMPTVRLQKDGTCVMDGKTYYWKPIGASGNQSLMLPTLELYDGIKPVFRVDFNFGDQPDMVVLNLNGLSDGSWVQYMSEADVFYPAAEKWQSQDGQMLAVFSDEQLYLNEDVCELSKVTMEFGYRNDMYCMSVSLYLNGADSSVRGRLVFTKWSKELLVELHLEEVDQTIILERMGGNGGNEEDAEQNAMIRKYEEALEILSLLKDSDGGLSYNGDERSRQEWLAYIRQAMIDADGYGESSQILANFTRLENVLVGVSTDPNGGSYVKEYRYDAAGRMIFANDDFYTMYLYCTLELPITPHYYFEYDDENRVSRIIHKNGEELYATITLTYNDQGQVRRMDIRMADGEERFATFAYSMDMMPHTLNSELQEDEEWEEEWGEEPEEGAFDVLISITYGEMFIDFAWTPDFDGYTYSGIIAYFPVNEDEGVAYSEHVEYDEQDRRIKKTVWLDDVVSTVCTYAYDAAGNLISETHTDANGQSITYYYIYETVLVYDFTA